MIHMLHHERLERLYVEVNFLKLYLLQSVQGVSLLEPIRPVYK